MRKSLVFILFFAHTSLWSQKAEKKVHQDDAFFKKHIVRNIDLKSPANEKLFGRNNIFTSILLEAVQEGKLTAYKDIDLKAPLSVHEFLKKLEIPGEDSAVFYNANNLSVIEMGENLVFDKRRSVLDFEMEYITLFIPAGENYKGIQEPVASFKYEDCIRIFREDKRAVCINPLKNGKNLNYAEAFILRLFTSDIVKIGQPGDLYFDQAYADQVSAFLATKNAENELVEFIYKLYHPK